MIQKQTLQYNYFCASYSPLMMKLLKALFIAFLLTVSANSFSQTKNVNNKPAAGAAKQYKYETIADDPLKARIYTLDNGLKVYISVYKDEPRFQSMIGVKAGSKTDPQDATGLAHYLEHMLFKGTDKYGTLDYAKEKPLLDSIYNLYDVYGQTKDSIQRLKIYHQIDTVSNIASKYAITNEFDKMMNAMGVTGTNAFTSVEQTVYVNDVPSNQLKNFIAVEAERFRHPVMRIFHTELEAVYEEKNRGLDNDNRKIQEALFSGLWTHHPYGTQTTIGTVEHLKNPSLKRINEYLQTYYVPNNMVIALSGDINPDEAIKAIDEHFGKMKSKPVPVFTSSKESLIKQPIVKDVYGPDAESVTIGFRFNGASSADADLITMVDMILSNGQAGLLDLNLNQAQKVLSSGSYTYIMKDYSAHVLYGRPREGQTLQQVRDSLLAQIYEIKLGNFPDWIIDAIVTNLRLEQQENYEHNRSRASDMLNSEILGIDYKDQVNQLNRLSKINKQQVIDFVRTWYGEDYVVVYKHTGEDNNTVKVVKPLITPVTTNTDAQSSFVKNMMEANVKPIQPVFIDFNQSIKKLKLKSGIPLHYVQNKENKLFNLYYIFDMGNNSEKKLGLALSYLKYLGTYKHSAVELQQEFYKLGCDYDVFVSDDQVYLSLSGLNENFDKALPLFEDIINHPKPDGVAFGNYITDVLKKRSDAKLNKNVILRGLGNYAKYGPQSPFTNVLSEPDLRGLYANDMTYLLQTLSGYEHRINYYGPTDTISLLTLLNKEHIAQLPLHPLIAAKKFTEYSANANQVFMLDYDMKQAEIQLYGKGADFNKSMEPVVQLYNEYFGGSMASPVFQTLRESKALAYSVASRYQRPIFKDRAYFNFAYIGTQADKVPEALPGLLDLLTNFPMSEPGFAAAKASLTQEIQTERITKSDILFTYDAYKRLGIDYDLRKDVYAAIPKLTLKDLNTFHDQYIKKSGYNIMVLGKRDKIDMEALKKQGEVFGLELKDVFGY